MTAHLLIMDKGNCHEGSTQLKDVMKRNVEVVGPDTPLCEAARKMSALNLTVLPVCEGSKIVGLLTSRDLTIRATAQGCDPRTGRVREVMMLPPVYGREDQDVNQAVDLMERWQLRRLPVLDRRMRLVGIISWRDLQGHNGAAGGGTKPCKMVGQDKYNMRGMAAHPVGRLAEGA